MQPILRFLVFISFADEYCEMRERYYPQKTSLSTYDLMKELFGLNGKRMLKSWNGRYLTEGWRRGII
ncbi:hypothetical protein PRIPAC_71466 [Pristionchus pacificus]|uniref:Uncharacterized protein n=1 Tax=Pristionchus pacificus TaxID=54126 RepID=A0A2A6B572_PRIPA|nr:hypothetical protein PRIPAC_71466 [Pristionchus pacificus]|eukprot:PDM61026.1 hypothetical protein PRIPAC_54832 [Pristionchus pacificus]